MSQSQVLIVEDDQGLCEALIDTLELAGYACTGADSAESALLHLSRKPVDIVISDVQMDRMTGLQLLKSIKRSHPQIPVLLMTAYAKIEDAVSAIREGALDYFTKPFSPEVLVNQVSRYIPLNSASLQDIVYGDPKTESLLQLSARVAESEANVMITGPSGTGKEILSNFIHLHSHRAKQPFVAINCAAIPENMLEATLFGYEKGAFTGAINACPGKFEQAQGGTILLDEITEMDLGLQAKLLRVIQEKEVERLGSRKSLQLDVRIIATSNRDLKEAVTTGCFREDLFYRLNVFPLQWPALCERKGDILPIATHLLTRYAKANNRPIPTLSPQVASLLENYPWPGNVRELDNVIQRALILCQTQTLLPEHFVLENSEMTFNPQSQIPYAGNELKQQELHTILETLKQCDGNRQEVSKRLGISPRTLRYKLAKLRDAGIDISG